EKNNPLYLKNFSNTHPDLKYHYIAHTSIDVIEERGTFRPLIKRHHRYGYMTNTRVKFVVVVSVTEGIIRDAEMKAIFKRIHAAYLSQICNPFYNLDSQRSIDSKAFTRAIEAIGVNANAKATMDI
ncbi:Sedlin, partial [Fennellomyces sp. T-0311]